MKCEDLCEPNEELLPQRLESYLGPLTDEQQVRLYAFYRYTPDTKLRNKAKKLLLAANDELAALLSARLPLATVKGKKLAENLTKHMAYPIDVVSLALECARWTQQWPSQDRELGYTQGSGALWLLQHKDSAVRLRGLKAFVDGVTLQVERQDLPTIPDELATLSELVSVNLNYNRITKTRFPKSLLQLPKLRALGVCGNGLTTLPKPLLALEALRVLLLDSNHFTSLPATTQWKHLEILTLRHCKLSAVPEFVTQLSSLRVLDLSYNDDLREMPESIGELSNLRLLYQPKFLPKAELSRLTKLLPLCQISRGHTRWGLRDLGLCGLGHLCPRCLTEGQDGVSSFDGRRLCGACLVDQDARSEQGMRVPSKMQAPWPVL